MKPSLQQIYETLFANYGPQGWWPGETPFEVLVGAVLVQNTAWKNVATAVQNLATADVLSPQALHALKQTKLEGLVRPCGYFRLKARRLRNLNDLIIEQFDGSLESLFAVERPALRELLLSVNGVGPETADSIMLYAANLPAFVVDTYTARVMKRHGWIEPSAKYHDLQDHFVQGLPEDVALFNEYHALLVRVGHLHCRRKPKCDDCPLQFWLPKTGPIEVEN